MEPPEIRYTHAKDGTRVLYAQNSGAGASLFWVSWRGVVHNRVEAANWAREHGVE